MNTEERISKISKAYFSKGLERARLSDLSGAAELLKRSLRFDKFNTRARNLLGLIFYETGETADALVQWIVSINLSPSGNDAVRYLEEIQKKPGVLAEESTLTRRFNQALKTAQDGGEDFSIIELKDILKKKPGFIKARVLLGLLYMGRGEFENAENVLSSVLQKDRNHPLATILLDEIRKEKPGARITPGAEGIAPVSGGLRNDDVIIPGTKRGIENTHIALILLTGIIVGLFAFYILILPTVRRSYNAALSEDIVRNSNLMSELNTSYTELKKEYESLSENFEDVSGRLNAYEQENLDFTTAYETLTSIIDTAGGGDYLTAAEMYVSVNRENITAEPLTGLLADADRIMLTDGFEAVTDLGTDAWNGGKKAEAEEYYRLALSIKEDDPEAMFLLARLLQSENRITEANALFDRIVGEHPESPYAERSVAARGY